MTTISYEPQQIPADKLDRAIELDTVFIVNDDGSIELEGGFAPNVTGHQGHVDPTIENDPERWEFYSRGYTGQQGYSGPEMHSSESLAGRLGTDILAEPGTYAVVGVRYDCDSDFCDVRPGETFCAEGLHLESWAVLRDVREPVKDETPPTIIVDEVGNLDPFDLTALMTSAREGLLSSPEVIESEVIEEYTAEEG